MIHCIVCAVDGSGHSDKAVKIAVDLAARYQAKLAFLHVYMKGMSFQELESFSRHAHLRGIVADETARLKENLSAVSGPYPVIYIPPPSENAVTRIAEILLEDARQVAVSKSIKDVSVATADGKPAEQILEFAKLQKADLIVMGSRGLSGLKGLFVGSTSAKVSHLAPCTCVTVV